MSVVLSQATIQTSVLCSTLESEGRGSLEGWGRLVKCEMGLSAVVPEWLIGAVQDQTCPDILGIPSTLHEFV